MVLLKLYLLKDWSHQWHHGIETVIYEAGLKLCDYDYVSRETSFNNGSSMLFARGGGYSHTLFIRVCAAQQGRDFEAPDLERAIHFRGVF